MDVRAALKDQYHAGLAMLADCIRQCPPDLWAAPNPPKEEGGMERSFWRIAFHAIYFTHLYLVQEEAAFEAPPSDLAVTRRADFEALWHAPWALEPYELPAATEPCPKEEILAYVDHVVSLIDPTVDALDLGREDCGFSWYKQISKLSHELLNLRHLQGHVGQLSELLMLRGIDTRWLSRRPR